MTGPFDPDHDNPERADLVCPLWVGPGGDASFNQIPDFYRVNVTVPHPWHPVIEPGQGVMLRAMWDHLPKLGPLGVLDAAIHGTHGFRFQS